MKEIEMKEMYNLFNENRFEESYEKALYLESFCYAAFDEENQDSKESPILSEFIGRCLLKLVCELLKKKKIKNIFVASF